MSEPSLDVLVRTFAPVAPQEPLTGAPAHVSNNLLSNRGQTTVGTGGGTEVGSNEAAQGFTTGSLGRGLQLEECPNRTSNSSNPGEVSAALWSATSDDPPVPDARIATLIHSTGTLKTGINTFNPLAGTTLKAGTTYFVFLSYTGLDAAGTNYLELNATTSTSADAGEVPVWSIGTDFVRTRSPQGEWGTGEVLLTTIQFSVHGSFVVNPDPPGPNVSEPDGGDCAFGNTTQWRSAGR